MKDFYLIPVKLQFELGECAHLHQTGGVFLSRNAYWKIKSLGSVLIGQFLQLRLAGRSEAEAIEQVTKKQ